MTNDLLAASIRYAGSTVLITGGLGFLGSALVEALCSVPCRVVLLVRQGRRVEKPRDTVAELDYVHGDIRTAETWSQVLPGVDYVFHFAAQTSAYVADQDPLEDFGVNVVPVVQLLETCRRLGLGPKILFSGSVTQAGLPSQLPVDESVQDHPIIVYDIHKLMAEKYLRFYASNIQIPTVTLRLPNVYGPGVRVGSDDRGVLNQMIRKALRGNPLTVYGGGERIRDYVFIEDVIRAFLVAGSHAQEIIGNYYVIGSGQGIRIVDAFKLVADRAQSVLETRPEVVHLPPPNALPPIEERDFVADIRGFNRDTGWAPQISLSDGIDLTLSYMLSQNSLGKVNAG